MSSIVERWKIYKQRANINDSMEQLVLDTISEIEQLKTENIRCIRALEHIKRTSTDMLDQNKRRGPKC